VANVNWTQEAVRWLSEIHDFIAEDDADAAQRVVRGIYERAQTLRTFPNLGYQYVNSDRTVRFCFSATIELHT
jgi:plasmid stabilization system protein ParE